MAVWVRRLATRAIEQVAGSGVGIDDEGRLYFPDGLDPPRVHRFIELVLDQRFPSPKQALRALFARVGVAATAVQALEEVLAEDGTIVWSEVGKHPVHLSGALPKLRQIPVHFRAFLVDGLGLADEEDGTLERAVVSTRQAAAERIGCEPSWDAILAEPDAVEALARDWRQRTAGAA